MTLVVNIFIQIQKNLYNVCKTVLLIIVTVFLFDINRIKLYNYYVFLFANRVYFPIIIAKSFL